MSVTAQGTQPFSYQWRKDGANVTGATTNKLILSNVALSDAGTYTAIVSNAVGSTTADPVTLEVQSSAPSEPAQPSAPSITTQPAAQSIPVGHEARFVSGSSSGTGYWQLSTDNGSSWSALSDNSTYRGTNSGTLIVNDVTSAMNGYRYRFVSTNGSASTTSATATLSVVGAILSQPVGLAFNSSGALVVVDATLNTANTVTNGALSVLAGASGSAGSADGAGGTARFNQPRGIAIDAADNLYIADSANATVRKITATGVVSTLAGSASVRGNADGAGAAATFSSPSGMAIDSAGNLYVTDTANHTLRKIAANGAVSTLAGSAGAAGSADGNGTSARFNRPGGVVIDRSGNVFVADSANNTIRKIIPGGAVSTLAGLAGVSGSADGSGVDARFNQPAGLAIDSSGNLYVADAGNSAIRKVTPAGTVSTFAGLPTIAGLLDGSGPEAWFNQPQALAIDRAGNLWVADTGNAAIRKVTPGGVVSTVGFSLAEVGSGVTAPTPSNPTPTPGTSSGGGSGGGGGGGGGAPSTWFLGALAVLVFARWKLGGARPPDALANASGDRVPPF